uniref:Uncharacterized protein n=1 Tax=Glossina brevipalpis TaxID=37001 RepID=A0A1A9WSN4_9MUSC
MADNNNIYTEKNKIALGIVPAASSFVGGNRLLAAYFKRKRMSVLLPPSLWPLFHNQELNYLTVQQLCYLQQLCYEQQHFRRVVQNSFNKLHRTCILAYLHMKFIVAGFRRHIDQLYKPYGTSVILIHKMGGNLKWFRRRSLQFQIMISNSRPL